MSCGWIDAQDQGRAAACSLSHAPWPADFLYGSAHATVRSRRPHGLVNSPPDHHVSSAGRPGATGREVDRPIVRPSTADLRRPAA